MPEAIAVTLVPHDPLWTAEAEAGMASPAGATAR
jgi:hypothetical protein